MTIMIISGGLFQEKFCIGLGIAEISIFSYHDRCTVQESIPKEI